MLLNKARESDRKDAYISYNLARILEQENKIDQATELYEELLLEIPTFGRLHYHLSQTYAAKGMVGNSHYHTGVLSFLEGNPKNARYHLKEASEKLAPKDPLQDKIRELLKSVKQLEKM